MKIAKAPDTLVLVLTEHEANALGVALQAALTRGDILPPAEDREFWNRMSRKLAEALTTTTE